MQQGSAVCRPIDRFINLSEKSPAEQIITTLKKTRVKYYRAAVHRRMAGDGANNETKERGEQSASARGEPHSRVGGTAECDHPPEPPGNRNSTSTMNAIANCRYGSPTSFIEICQVIVNAVHRSVINYPVYKYPKTSRPY